MIILLLILLYLLPVIIPISFFLLIVYNGSKEMENLEKLYKKE